MTRRRDRIRGIGVWTAVCYAAAAAVCLTVQGVIAQGATAAELAMGFRVGEVRQDSAVVWTRVTRFPQRHWDGYREPAKVEPRTDEYTPSTIAIEDREGAAPGAPGEVRVVYSTRADLSEAVSTAWRAAEPEQDYAVHIPLAELLPGVRYYLKVEARDNDQSRVSASVSGSFATPAPADQWQDVRFAVLTCQSYWHLDHRDGYHIYPAMQDMHLDFVAATGDTVYLDSDAPRARTVELARYHWQRMYSLPRLVEFHRRTPGYWEVDDHDALANDCWPGQDVPWMKPLTFADGIRIFREQNPAPDPAYRTVRWGEGLQIWLVDAREHRSPTTIPDGPEKSIWGAEQREWLKRTLLESDARFKLVISPTPIVGPDRDNKSDNHANKAFAHEGESFRRWTKESGLSNLYVVCGDRHWQYMSVDPTTGLREFACGPASDEHATGSPGQDVRYQPFHREMGGFLSVTVTRRDGEPVITFRHHDVFGKTVYEFSDR